MKPGSWQRAAFYAAALVIAIVGAVSTHDNAMTGADLAVGVAR